MTYLLTFTCYGAHLPGEEGSIDRFHNLPGSRVSAQNVPLLRSAKLALRHPPFEMHAETRDVVLRAVCEVGDHKGWDLLAVHVRSNHVHIVMDGEATPEAALNVFRAYASRALNSRTETRASAIGRRFWARHGSTRYLWTRDQIDAAVRYVLEKRGVPMAVFAAGARSACSRARFGLGTAPCTEPRP